MFSYLIVFIFLIILFLFLYKSPVQEKFLLTICSFLSQVYPVSFLYSYGIEKESVLYLLLFIVFSIICIILLFKNISSHFIFYNTKLKDKKIHKNISYKKCSPFMGMIRKELFVLGNDPFYYKNTIRYSLVYSALFFVGSFYLKNIENISSLLPNILAMLSCMFSIAPFLLRKEKVMYSFPYPISFFLIYLSKVAVSFIVGSFFIICNGCIAILFYNLPLFLKIFVFVLPLSLLFLISSLSLFFLYLFYEKEWGFLFVSLFNFFVSIFVGLGQFFIFYFATLPIFLVSLTVLFIFGGFLSFSLFFLSKNNIQKKISKQG